MSYKLVNLVYSRRLTDEEEIEGAKAKVGSGCLKAVALRLADLARDDGSSIYPSLAKIAREIEFCERSVRLAMRKLEEMKVLVEVSKGGGRNKATTYRIDVPTLKALPDVKGALDSGYQVEQGKQNPESGAPFSQDENPAPHAPFEEETRNLIPQNPESNAPNPLENHYSPSESGADAPSKGKIVWREAIALLSPFLPQARSRPLIGKWLKRAGPDPLLAIIRDAKRAGTEDPVAYVEAALAKSHPPPPDPASLSDEEWGFRIKAAINRKEWLSDWGPKPGKPKCLVPHPLITPELIAAISPAKPAARGDNLQLQLGDRR